MLLILRVVVGFCLFFCSSLAEDLLVLTVATERTDGFERYIRSASHYNFNISVVGMGEKWKGGNMNYAGGGHKIALLKKELEKYKSDSNLRILFTDSYDVVFAAAPAEILKKYDQLGGGVIFSAEDYLWPDQSLLDQYPLVKLNEKRFLCSGGFIGPASSLYRIITAQDVTEGDDDQLYYTQLYLNTDLRDELQLKLDHRAEIFQNLHGALEEVQIKFASDKSYLYNTKTGTKPTIIHGNGPVKSEFNRISDYLFDQWTLSNGCQSCSTDTIDLSAITENEYPLVTMAVLIEVPTPFLDNFLRHIISLDYPKSKLNLILHNNVEYHSTVVNDLLKNEATKFKEYNSLTYLRPEDQISDSSARNMALSECEKKNCDFLFMVDSHAHLDNNSTLKLLIHQNRSILAPLLLRPGQYWSNIWGAVSSDGWYARSDDYMDITEYKRMGIWNIPYVNHVYLIQGQKAGQLTDYWSPRYAPVTDSVTTDQSQLLDVDMSFAFNMREMGHFTFATNLHHFGHLIDSEEFDTNKLHPDLFQIDKNNQDWQERYIHPDYWEVINPNSTIGQPCPDVFWFPVVTDRYCKELIGEMEHFGEWSGGGHQPSKDVRLNGGYENVPTVDIHWRQLGVHDQWLSFLAKYIQPVQLKLFEGYYSDDSKPKAFMAFVVRYRPGEQDHLKPHQDASMYTINIALNQAKIDYEGGGCRFTRYNCAVRETKMGWSFIHPGRLTHQHEGLRTTKGTRYIMVSFVDP